MLNRSRRPPNLREVGRHQVDWLELWNFKKCAIGSKLNSHEISIGDGKLNPIGSGFIGPHEIRIPIKGGMTIPNIATFDHGTYSFES